jgi:Domain of unknown function (DUF4345)
LGAGSGVVILAFNFEKSMSKRILQLITALLGLIPVVTGIIALGGVNDPLYAALGLPQSALLDSNLRFFAGLWIGFGIAMLWLVPRIERQTVLFRALWGAIFLGGVGRLLSMVAVGMPPAQFFGFTVLELVGAPLFIYWQQRVAQSTGSSIVHSGLQPSGARV